ncbi:MAG: MiaB/RimO family radical SAM methylthiotransferase, partial [Clostridia bacterium]|nr:MiaB/RimO family radical SAM methylthiotransferase [Clostridia bacterium]
TGEQKCRQVLHGLRRDHPDAVICAMGCYTQVCDDPAAVFADADIVVGVKHRTELPALVESFLASHKQIVLIGDNRHLPYETMSADFLPGHDRAVLKIGEGCNQYCTYCIIPFARGNPRSRPLSEIREEALRFAENGYKELVVSATNLSLYGKDFKEDASLVDALQAMSVDGIERIRLGSLEPRFLLDVVKKGLCQVKKLCPHFHISLQSGSDSVLSRMKRHYTQDDVWQVVSAIRAELPNATFSADIICGFPGETEAEADQTYAFAKKVGFLHIHAFPYSPREGTVAAKMEGQLPSATKAARVRALTALNKETEAAILKNLVGTTAFVLIEGKPKVHKGQSYAFGFTENYAKVLLPKEYLEQKGQIVSVTLKETADGFLFA